ncbi:MAG: hypothetical protein JXR90_14170 [Spirochaetes bacterium]|nr:hypothetical protein [Spirochaetota bacterium]
MKKSLSILQIVMWFVLATIILSSCSPEYRLHRLIALHPELVKNDTIHIQDTTFLPELRIDTVVHESRLRDTVTITKEKLTVKIHQLRDTVYIEARQDPDTIIITKEIPVERVIHHTNPPSFTEKLWGQFRFSFILSLVCLLLLIAFVIRITRK